MSFRTQGYGRKRNWAPAQTFVTVATIETRCRGCGREIHVGDQYKRTAWEDSERHVDCAAARQVQP